MLLMGQREADIEGADRDLLTGVLACDFRSIARLITLVENGSPASPPLLGRLFGHTGRCFTVGVTGAPGAGKSTLVDILLWHYRKQGNRVGVLAVDPTSPFTGGAILGDRIRMQSRSVDSGIFIRSMATRGHLGGLARATADALLVLDAAGFDPVFVETVGVGQDEVEVVRTADVNLLLLVPGMGDEIQAMKAGIMEIADIFVINKADRPGAERLEMEIRALAAVRGRLDGWIPEIVRTVATEGSGLEACAAAIGRFREFSAASEFRRQRSVQLQRDRLLEIVRARALDEVMSRPGYCEAVDVLALRVAGREIDPFSAAEQLLRSFR